MKLLRFRRLVTRCREQIHPKAWLLLLPAVLLLAMAAAAAFLAWQGFTLLTRDDLATSETAAAIQGLAAALSLAVTVCLVTVTAWYAFLVNKQIRLAGPDVSMDWYIAWVDPGRPPREAIRTPITELHHGPPSEQHIEWYFTIGLTNSGNQAVSVIKAVLICDDAFYFNYGGSHYSADCPLELRPHSAKTIFFDSDVAQRFLAMCKRLKSSHSRKLHVHVDLSSGRKLNSRKVPLRHFIV